MRNSCRFWSAAGVTLLAVVVGSAAIAQLTDDERKCTDAVYKSARNVGNQEQKHNRTCVKDGSLDIDACVDDESAKAADKRAKLLGLDDPGGKCATTPAFGVNTNLADVADGVEDGTDNIMRGAFGDPVDVGVAGDKCGDAVAKRAGKAYDTILKSFRGCAKGLGAINSINDLNGCAVTAAADPKAANFISKLSSDMDKKCTFMSPPTGMEDGDCSSCSDGATCSSCVGRITKCEACDAINNETGGSANCDLVDDGIANGSCGGTALHTCNLAASPASQLQMHIAALPVPLTFGLSGSLEHRHRRQHRDLPGPGHQSGQHPCHRLRLHFAGRELRPRRPVLRPRRPRLWPGARRRHRLGRQHRRLRKQRGLPDECHRCLPCRVWAGVHCARRRSAPASAPARPRRPAPRMRRASRRTAPATALIQSGAHAGICQVTCVDRMAHGPSDPGDTQCNLGLDVTVESAGPCDGTDTILDVGQLCIPLTTQRATATITDANFIFGSTVPPRPTSTTSRGARSPAPPSTAPFSPGSSLWARSTPSARLSATRRSGSRRPANRNRPSDARDARGREAPTPACASRR